MNNLAKALVLFLVSAVAETSDLSFVDSGGYELATWSYGEGDKTVVFVSGLGMGGESWKEYGVIDLLPANIKSISYNRPGNPPSDTVEEPAVMENHIKDLHSVILAHSAKSKVILVGHSLGGAIIRAYADTNTEKVAGLIFVDSSHEFSLANFTEEQVRKQAKAFGYEITHHRVREFWNLYENLEYVSLIEGLPNIPVIALTATQGVYGEHLKNLVAAHQSLGEGLSDFTHLEVIAPHIIQAAKPAAVTDAISAMLAKAMF